jgi:FkbM family methyltransferase
MGPEGSNLKFSENGSDWWALNSRGKWNDGYFVDVGASDGITASNTYLLEKFYKWKGICVDPNPSTLKSMCGARDVYLSDLCVYKESGKILNFKFLADQSKFYGWNQRSGLDGHISDQISVKMNDHKVFTITLTDLLDLANAPKIVDYISIDVEGSEIEVLQGLDFSKYDVRMLSIEYENEDNRSKINWLMSRNNYNRVDFDEHCTEDRYIKND